MKNCIFCICLFCMLAAHAADLPVWFDTFQSQRESLQSWQSFRAAYKLGFATNPTFIGGQALKVKIKFTPKVRAGVLLWRFPDVQMKKFRMRVKVPRQAKGVYLRMVTNDTRGDATFFKPWVGGKQIVPLPVQTNEGKKMQKASPLPPGKWVTYEVSIPDDVFYVQMKQKPKGHAVEEYALMNTDRNQLNLSADSRPATEVFFISFIVNKNSPLFGKELEFLVDLAEIYCPYDGRH